MAEVAQFCEITGGTPEQAAFFLSMAGNNVDNAIAAFFENDGGMGQPSAMQGVEDVVESTPAPSRPAPSPAPARQPPPAQAPPPAKRSAPAKGNITSLSDLNKGGDDSDDEDAPTEWFAGGHKSGQMVQDPTKRGPGGVQDRVESLFDRAREAGAVQGRPEDLQQGGRGGGFSAFKGTGNKLSGESSGQAAPPAEGAAAGPPESVTHTITFWKNGFTVDNGPLRTFDDPANEPFMAAIAKGHCPRELEPPSRDTMVNINLVRRTEENYTPPPEPKYVAFSGTGRSLGGGSAAAAAAAAPPPAAAPAAAAGEWSVDETKPTTKIQLRLSDGQRVVGVFNLHHTVGDIRRFIATVRPGGLASYALQTQDRPPKLLTDNSETIEAAKLANSVIVQVAA